MTYLFDDAIRYDDSPNLDAFGGLRTTSARIIGEYRINLGVASALEYVSLTAGSGVRTTNFNKKQVELTTTTANGDRVVHQTRQYHPYIAGTSNKFLMTFKMDTAKANLQQMVGAFDDDNGIFFRMNGTTPEVVVRKGGVDNEVVARTAWNKDRLDGSMNEFNQSGFTIDFTKCHILYLDYQWLGVGRVRIGFVINGKPIVVHEFYHANNTVEPYMFSAGLPVRWELKNNGAVASASQMNAICAGVYCEGSEREVGFTVSVSTDGTVQTVTNTTDGQCLLAIRLKNSINGLPVRVLARLKEWALYSTNDAQYKVVIFNDASKFANTPSWTAVPGRSACEYAKGVTMVSGWAADNNFSVLIDGFAQGAVGAGSGTNSLREIDNINNTIAQNYDSTNSLVLAIVAYKLANNSDMKATMVWTEIR